jgi:ribonuclease BN (tRNA processing enzyme)
MTGRDAGEAATKAGAARLLLTHLVPAWGDEATTLHEAKSTFDGPIDVVRPGAIYEI